MLNWPSSTLYNGLEDVAQSRTDDVALRTAETTLTYGELVSESRSVAAGLSELGVRKGDTIAIWLGNRPEWLTTQLAASYLGARVVAVNTRYRRHELEYMLDDSECTVILTEGEFLGSDYLEMLSDIVPGIEKASPGELSSGDLPLREVISVEASEEYSAVRSYADVIDVEASATDISLAGDEELPVIVFYTSGTTSNPKGCLHSSRSVLNHSYAVGDHFSVSERDVGLALLPICGVMGYNFALSTLAHGGELVLQPYFDAERAVRNVVERDVTYCSATDEMYGRMVSTADDESFESLSRGAVFFANGFDEDEFERIESAVGFPIVQPYGSSEVNSQVFVGDPTDARHHRKRVGGPLVHPDEEDAKIVDPETGDRLPAGKRGELCLRGYNVLVRYHNKPEQTDAAFEDDWFHTGDLCERDEDGSLYFHSRIDDALRVRGFLVSPPEIEQAIESHPDVELAQVVGVDHPRHGEVPIAFVKGDLTAADVHDHLDDRIADYKQPAAVEIVAEFPRTEGPHGEKIRKTELRDRADDIVSF